jgi:hypothetical protein
MCIICNKEVNVNIECILCCRKVKKIPKELINLKYLVCIGSKIKTIPNTLVNLENLEVCYTNVKFIPDNLKLKGLKTNCNILISPKTYKQEPNNQRYLTFTNCQKRYKHKFKRTAALRMLKFAYDPKYIIGYNVKLQIKKLFTN